MSIDNATQDQTVKTEKKMKKKAPAAAVGNEDQPPTKKKKKVQVQPSVDSAIPPSASSIAMREAEKDGSLGDKKKKKQKRQKVEIEQQQQRAESEQQKRSEEEPNPKKKKKKKKELKGILKVKSAEINSSPPPPPPPHLDDVEDDAGAEGENDAEAAGGNDAGAEGALLVNPSFQPRADGASSSSPADPKKDKMKKKKEIKRAAKATAQEARKNDEGEEIRVLEARQYLKTWKEDKQMWKFNKNRQTWLLKNLFHPSAFDDELFSILVEYLRPLKGNARAETIKQAEAKVNEDAVQFLEAERARVVVQMLA